MLRAPTVQGTGIVRKTKINNKEHPKLAAQTYDHVETMFHNMERVSDANEGILLDHNRLWNLDEADINVTGGKLDCAFACESTKNGGKRGIHSKFLNEAGKHITAVVTDAIRGILMPPFFIIVGKIINSDWWALISGVFREAPHDVIARFTLPNCFPLEAVIKVNDNGSMEGAIMPLLFIILTCPWS